MTKKYNPVDDEDFMFANFKKTEIDFGDEEEVTSGPKPKLDMFKEIIPNFQDGNKAFLEEQTPAMRKTFSALIAQRFISIVPDYSTERDYFIFAVNKISNINLFAISDHPELQWKLLTLCRTNHRQKHGWIPMSPKRKKQDSTAKYMLQWYPNVNDLELDIILKSMNREQFEQFVKSTGATDTELRNTLENYDIDNGLVPEKASKKKAKGSTKG